jgi:hypothetical protein
MMGRFWKIVGLPCVFGPWGWKMESGNCIGRVFFIGNHRTGRVVVSFTYERECTGS